MSTHLLPSVLPQDEINLIASQVHGGAENIQDIYALSPIQDGILFHHISSQKGDPYLTASRFIFDTRELLDRYLEAYQKVLERNDIMRTVVVCEGLSNPVQVVLCSLKVPVIELSFDPRNGPIPDQLTAMFHPSHYKSDLTRATWYRFAVVQDTDGRWIADEFSHHIGGDQMTVQRIMIETQAFLTGTSKNLPKPQQFRDVIAKVRSGPSSQDYKQFFTKMLDGVESVTLPYGMFNANQHGPTAHEARRSLSVSLDKRLKYHSKKLGVSSARICHLAWAQVMSRISGQERVVFGTIVSSRGSVASIKNVFGPYINTLPIRVDLEGASVIDSLYRVCDDITELLKYEHAPLALAQRCRKTPDHGPLFCSVLNFRKIENRANTIAIDGIQLEERRDVMTYPFTMTVESGNDTLGLLSVVKEPFDADRICGYMLQALESIVDALDNSPGMPVRNLEVIPRAEQEMLVKSWNDTSMVFPGNRPIHHMFEQHTHLNPQAAAIVYEGQSMSYRELNERSNQLAHHLIKLGVKPDSLVAVCVDRSVTMMIGILGVLKAGGAYVPIDPAFASKRLHDILADASPSVLLADQSGLSALRSSLLHSIPVVDPNTLFEESIANPRVPGLGPQHLAYVIYTSGSTGKPKGVMIDHSSVANLALTRPEVFGVGSSSRVLQFFSVSFDGSVHEIVSALCNGGSLHILSNSTRMDKALLWEYMRLHSITHATLTPSLIQDCKDMPTLNTPLTMLLAGEALSPSILKDLAESIPNGTIINDYGPTEATVDAVGWRCHPGFQGEALPIGRPHANKRVYVLDGNQKLLPVGAIGELYIAGVGVARGYLNRPELNEKAFFPEPFNTDYNARMYKTGDLVKYLPNGDLVFLGRRDHQVKIRGFRVELGEVETRLVEHPMVKEAVVAAKSEGDGKRLVAYVIANNSADLARILREHLKAKLPDYMVPSAFVRMECFPLTSNGKLDLKALPEPDGNAVISQGYEAPQGNVENSLATIWGNLLKIDRVGRHDNFFDLGGHSLLAVKMIKEAKSILGSELSLQALFKTPTIAELTPYLKKQEDKKDSSFNVLFPLKPQGNRLPLFCVHPAGGLCWSYSRLAKHFHPEQPIYGLQARGFDGTEARASSIQEMAQDYVSQIRSIQPRGPYHLLGWSFGGNVAQCVAVQLQKLGEKVAFLALMDSTLDYEAISADIEADIEKVFFTEYALSAGDGGSEEDGKLLWAKVQGAIRHNLSIAKSHATQVYSGDLIYFSATKTKPFIDPMSWVPYTLGRVGVHNVECKHIAMDQPDHIAIVGRVLGKRLEESQKERRLSKL
ncbi:hypothetical protein EDD11_008218 [Mortierella claussenii]|nr:hypothetical protein EDD11_008218 [Mortierella claussenii]